MTLLRFVGLFIIIFIAIFYGEGKSAITFTERWRFTVPDITGIDQVSLRDINDDGCPEALVLRGRLILLYGPSQDSVLFRDSLIGGGMRRVYLGDVDRDSVADIVSGVTYSGNSVSDSAIAIDLYEGATGFSVRRSYFSNVQISQPNPGYFPPGTLETQGITAMTAFDLNEDGFDEFIFSYGYKETFQDEWTMARRETLLRAATPLFFSFPDSLQRTTRSSLSWVQPTRVDGLPVMAATISSYGLEVDMGDDQESAISTLSLIAWDGQFLRMIGVPTGYSSYDLYGEKYTIVFGCAGDIRPSDPYSEIVTRCFWCSDFAGLRLHRVIQKDSTELVWCRPDLSLVNMVYLQQCPGSFFGFSGDSFIQYDGDGNEIQSLSPIPTGKLSWVYPYNPSEPLLQAIVGDTVTLYEASVTTGTDGGGEDVPVPSSLAVSAPHPNPFNATQTIPLTAKPGKQLTVDVFNLLGQKVARVFDARVTTAQFSIPWKADQLPSGIYFIHATSGDESVTVKSILIK